MPVKRLHPREIFPLTIEVTVRSLRIFEHDGGVPRIFARDLPFKICALVTWDFEGCFVIDDPLMPTLASKASNRPSTSPSRSFKGSSPFKALFDMVIHSLLCGSLLKLTLRDRVQIFVPHVFYSYPFAFSATDPTDDPSNDFALFSHS